MPAASCPSRPANASRRRRRRGFTLIELLIGMALLAIVLAIAAPSFDGWLTRVRLDGQARALSSSLSYAKSEAIRRGVRVAVCPSPDPQAASPQCGADTPWSSGWLVFVDNTHVAGNGAGTVDGDDEILRIGDPMRRTTTTAAGAIAAWIAFSPNQLATGSGGVANGAIELCQGGQARSVAVTTTGRVNVNVVADGC